MNEAERIAANLTKSQIGAVLRFRLSADGKHYHCPAYRDGGQMRRSLEALGICGPDGIMSKLGLRVRTILEKQHATGGYQPFLPEGYAPASAVAGETAIGLEQWEQ